MGAATAFVVGSPSKPPCRAMVSGRIVASSCVTGVNSQYDARDIARLLAEKVLDRRGDIVRLRHAAKRAAVGDLLALLVVHGVGHGRVDESRRYGIDRDAELADLPCQRACEAFERGLGGRVGGEPLVAARG